MRTRFLRKHAVCVLSSPTGGGALRAERRLQFERISSVMHSVAARATGKWKGSVAFSSDGKQNVCVDTIYSESEEYYGFIVWLTPSIKERIFDVSNELKNVKYRHNKYPRNISYYFHSQQNQGHLLIRKHKTFVTHVLRADNNIHNTQYSSQRHTNVVIATYRTRNGAISAVVDAAARLQIRSKQNNRAFSA